MRFCTCRLSTLGGVDMVEVEPVELEAEGQRTVGTAPEFSIALLPKPNLNFVQFSKSDGTKWCPQMTLVLVDPAAHTRVVRTNASHFFLRATSLGKRCMDSVLLEFVHLPTTQYFGILTSWMDGWLDKLACLRGPACLLLRSSRKTQYNLWRHAAPFYAMRNFQEREVRSKKRLDQTSLLLHS